jgi:heme-degrading monooxygenase HmoA
MIAVIFDLWPAPDQQPIYFDLAAALKSDLQSMDGFISVERFESLATPGKFLSLSFWRDEATVAAWRNRAAHRDAQTRGRDGILTNYRLRVAHVVRHYGMTARDEAPPDSKALHNSSA